MRQSPILLCAALALPPVLAAAPAAPARPISIVNEKLHQYEDGPAVAPNHPYVPGETVFLSFQISGYQSDKERILVHFKVEAFDPGKKPIAEPKTGKVTAELAPEDKDWLPKVRQEFLVPPTAPSGTYRINAWVKDDTGGSEATKTIEFTVKGHDIQPAKGLEIQNFFFLRNETDTQHLGETPSYKPGDAVWARFDMVGFQHGPKNRYAVRYGLAVSNAEGKQLYAVPEAAADTDETFYPKRFVPGMLNFTLPPDIKPGVYSITLTTEDSGAGVKVDLKRQFRVE